MDDIGTSEHVIESLGCGLFQILVVFMVCIFTKLPVVYTFMFMSFGSYNPGWRCLDTANDTTQWPPSTTISSNFTKWTSSAMFNNSRNNTLNTSRNQRVLEPMRYNTHDDCRKFEECQHVEFYKEDSTIVTEWGLICSKAYIPSLMISIQMAGALVGSFVGGQCSDSFGRKTTTYASLAIITVLNGISIFSTSWPMFVALRFFLGVACGSVLAVYYVLTSEFLSKKWRAPLTSVPAWNVSAVLFSLTAMWLRDWRHLHIAITILSVICFLPVFWVPESLRWLEVKNKYESFIKTAGKIAKLNHKPLPELTITKDGENSAIVLHSIDSNKETEVKTIRTNRTYTPYDLFHWGYKLYTILYGIMWVFMSLIYYAITFGVKSLYGNFYVNLVLVFAVQLPFAIFPIVIPNILGRKIGTLVFIGFSALGLAGAACFEILTGDQVRSVGTLLAIMVGKVGMTSGWDINKVHMTEMYPTVVRGLALGWACLMARVGGIIAPYLIPNSPDTIFICYAIMSVLAFFCCVIECQFPETKGKPLKRSFNDPKQRANDDRNTAL